MDINNRREVAEQLNSLSIFIREGFCKGMVMIALPSYKHMNHLSKRLHDYAFSVATTVSPRFIPLPDPNTTLDFSTAIQRMEDLIAFFQRNAQRLEQSNLAAAAELALVKDLEITLQHSKMLLGFRPRCLENVGQRPRIFTKQPDTGMWTGTNKVLRTTQPVATPSSKPNNRKDRDGDVSPLELGSPIFSAHFTRHSWSAPALESSTRPQASRTARPRSNYLEVPPVSIGSPISSDAPTQHSKLHHDKQSPPFSKLPQDWSHVPRGKEGAMMRNPPSSHETPITSAKSGETAHKACGEPEHQHCSPLQVFMASIETPLAPPALLHRRRASDTSSEIVAPGPAVPPSSHASSEIGIGIIEQPEKDHKSTSSEDYHPIRVYPHGGVQRGSSTGRITPVNGAVSQAADASSDSARKRRAEAKELDRTRTWSVDSPRTSARGRGDWTTRNHSVKTESSFDHDDWIEKALTPNSAHEPEATSEIRDLKDQIASLQDQVANLATLMSKTACDEDLSPPPTSNKPIGGREPITCSCRSVRAGTSDDKPKWIEQPDPFQGRSSPPYVAHMNTEDGKLYILDTADGIPEPLDKSETPLRSSRGRQRIEGEEKIDMT